MKSISSIVNEMHGDEAIEFLMKNEDSFVVSQEELNKIKADAVVEATYKNRKSIIDGGDKWLCAVDDLINHANKLEEGES